MSESNGRIIVVDTETTGLDTTKHFAVEVAWTDLDLNDEPVSFIPPHDVRKALRVADIRALQINRYVDRIAGAEQGTVQDMAALHIALQGSTLAGSNPAFDAAILSKLFREAGLSPTPWHYRLLDIGAYAAGVLALDVVPGLWDVCRLIGYEQSELAHSAAADVVDTAACFRILRSINAKRQISVREVINGWGVEA